MNHNVLEQSEVRHTGFEEEFDPIFEVPAPRIGVEGSRVILENGAELPVHVCIKSGAPAAVVVSKTLRNPFNPFSWFGRRKKVKIGLSKKHKDARRVAFALTWSVFGMGLFLLLAGAVQSNPVSLGIGAFLVVISGLFRAACPVWASRVSEGRIVIRGTGREFRESFFQT